MGFIGYSAQPLFPFLLMKAFWCALQKPPYSLYNSLGLGLIDFTFWGFKREQYKLALASLLFFSPLPTVTETDNVGILLHWLENILPSVGQLVGQCDSRAAHCLHKTFWGWCKWWRKKNKYRQKLTPNDDFYIPRSNFIRWAGGKRNCMFTDESQRRN